MAYTIEQHEELKAHIAQGVSRVRYATGNGQYREVQYQSVSDMLRVLTLMAAELGIDPPVTQTVRPGYFVIAIDRRR